MDENKVQKLTEFLSQFKRFCAPSRYVVAYKVLIEQDKSFSNSDQYVEQAYHDMLVDADRKISYNSNGEILFK